ncbi:MAG: D-alanine--D-alanine ligase family protein [Bacilli bacterium]
MKKILMICGGNSFEHEISCKSAKCILDNIDKNLFEITVVGIDKQNNWYLFNDNYDDLFNNIWIKADKINNIIDFIKIFDVVFPVLHGLNGEDGTIQGMLELFKIKYVGSKVLSSALGMDKQFSKIIFEKANIPITPYLTMHNNDINYQQIKKRLNFPVIVKPARGGSSCGVNKANNKKELNDAIQKANVFDTKIIIEKLIVGKELECAIVQGKKIMISSVGQIASANELYDYNAKYLNSNSQTIIPAKISKRISDMIKQYTKDAFIAINGNGLARVDFFYDEENDKIYLNEINTMPGFTSISMFPKLFEHDKISYKKLITFLINNA